MRFLVITLFIFSFLAPVTPTKIPAQPIPERNPMLDFCCDYRKKPEEANNPKVCNLRLGLRELFKDPDRVALKKYTGIYDDSYLINYVNEHDQHEPIMIRKFLQNNQIWMNFKYMYDLRNVPHSSGFVECAFDWNHYYIAYHTWEHNLLDEKFLRVFRGKSAKNRLNFYIELIEMSMELLNMNLVHTQIRPEHIMLDKDGKPHLIGFSKICPVNTWVGKRPFNWFQYPWEMELKYQVEKLDDIYSIYMIIVYLESKDGLDEFQWVINDDDVWMESETYCDNVYKNKACKRLFWERLNAIFTKPFGPVYEWDEKTTPPKRTIGTILRYGLNQDDHRSMAEILADWKNAQKEWEATLPQKQMI